MESMAALTSNVQVRILGQLALAMVLGGIVGYERERADKPAGLRTHMLVAGSTALLVGMAKLLVSDSGIDTQYVTVDPLRIVQAIVTGVTFLGAGTILRDRDETAVEGLTTAASLFFMTSVGIAVALNQFILAVGGTILVLIVLRGMKPFDVE